MTVKVSYMSEVAATQFIPTKSVAIISITEPGRLAPIASEKFGMALRVQFCDAEYDEAMIERFASRGIKFDPEAKGFPSQSSILPIIAFVNNAIKNPAIEEIIVHCHAGRRRSAAVAQFICERIGIEFSNTHGECNVTVYELLQNPSRFDSVRRVKWWKFWQ